MFHNKKQKIANFSTRQGVILSFIIQCASQISPSSPLSLPPFPPPPLPLLPSPRSLCSLLLCDLEEEVGVSLGLREVLDVVDLV